MPGKHKRLAAHVLQLRVYVTMLATVTKDGLTDHLPKRNLVLPDILGLLRNEIRDLRDDITRRD